MIRCVIFDCDGTLVDSEGLSCMALQQQLLIEGVDENAAELVEQYRGMKLSAILRHLEIKHRITLREGFVRDYRSRVSVLFPNQLKPCLGVVETLSKLELAMCVASSGPMKKIRQALSVTALSRYFGDRIYSSYDIASWKPEPDIFLYAANNMGFDVHECMVVEDSAVGVQAAKSAGMTAVYCGAHSIDIQGEEHQISHMSQLHDIIRKVA